MIRSGFSIILLPIGFVAREKLVGGDLLCPKSRLVLRSIERQGTRCRRKATSS
jgi:hypothetical protein